MRQPAVVTTLGTKWGTAVAQRRALLQLSQAQLAELCGVTQQTISKIESGGMIPHDRLKAVIADRLMIEPAELFEWPSRSEMAEVVA